MCDCRPAVDWVVARDPDRVLIHDSTGAACFPWIVEFAPKIRHKQFVIDGEGGAARAS